jgi:hypothetical protein
MKDSEDNSQSESDEYFSNLRAKLNKIRENNPPIYKGRVLQYKEWPSFDGDDMSPIWVDVYAYPAWGKIDSLLATEYKKMGKDLLGVPGKVYTGPDLAELEKK